MSDINYDNMNIEYVCQFNIGYKTMFPLSSNGQMLENSHILCKFFSQFPKVCECKKVYANLNPDFKVIESSIDL